MMATTLDFTSELCCGPGIFTDSIIQFRQPTFWRDAANHHYTPSVWLQSENGFQGSAIVRAGHYTGDIGAVQTN